MTSADKLKRLREERNLSQAEVAKALGLDRTTYVKYERGGSIRRNVSALARFFNVTTDYLLGNDTQPAQHTPTPSSLDQETAEFANQYQADENTRILFEAAKGAKPQDLKKAAEFLSFLKGKE